MKGFKPVDEEEKEIMDSIEKDEWVPAEKREGEIEKLERTARATFARSERMNVRISPRDLRNLKIRAMEEGVPYETLVASVIHKFLSGRLVERHDPD